ncbi:MAG: GAF domain-containing protein, partial [Acidobacteria bacterium]|nr:GAF domain-containing protein [Acidobacteriota bacterium]
MKEKDGSSKKDGRIPLEAAIVGDGGALPANPLAGGRADAVAAQGDGELRRMEKVLLERERLAALGADVATALAQSDTLPEMLHACAAALVEHLDAAFARVWTLDETEAVLELRASSGLYTHLDGPHSRVPVGKFKIGLIAEERRAHLTNDVLNDPRVGDKEWAAREGMVAFA